MTSYFCAIKKCLIITIKFLFDVGHRIGKVFIPFLLLKRLEFYACSSFNAFLTMDTVSQNLHHGDGSGIETPKFLKLEKLIVNF